MTEKKRKLNVIDILIILFVIAVLAVGSYMLINKENVSVNTKKIEYTVLLSEQTDSLAKEIKVGDVVTISHEDKDTAVVTKVDSSPASILTFNSVKGVYKYAEHESKFDILVTLEADGIETDTVVKIGNTSIKTGKSSAIRCSTYSAKGFIVSTSIK